MVEVDVQRILWLSLSVIGLIVVAFVLIAQVRRRLNAPDETAFSGGLGFTLSDLRQMHKAGQMSDEEFEKAKAKIVEAARRASERDRKPDDTVRQPLRQAKVESEDAPPPSSDEPSDPGAPPVRPL